MSMKHYTDVVDFMNTFGQTVLTEFKMPTTKLARLRYNLIKEEIEELREAVENDDIVEIADALTDILYVVHGAHAAFGTIPQCGEHGDGPWATVPKTNLPSVRHASIMMGNFDFWLDRLQGAFDPTLIKEDCAQYEIEYALNYLLSTTYDMAWRCGIDIYKCFNEVHSSNMSKVCKTHIEAVNSIQWRIDTAATSDVVNNYTGALVTEVNGFFVITRKSDGKGLKGRAYFDPDLAKIVKL